MKSVLRLTVVFFFICASGCRQENPSEFKEYPFTCFAASYAGGILQTDNGGISWFPLDLEQEELSYYFKRIYPDPVNGKVLYVTTTGNGLFTLDIEKKEISAIEHYSGQVVTSLAFWRFGPNADQAPVVGIEREGVFWYAEAAKSWHPLNAGLNYRDVHVLFASDKDLFAGTDKDLFRWVEEKQQWVSSASGMKNKNIIAMAGDPTGRILFAGAGVFQESKGLFEDVPCLYRSTDQGRTWTASAKGLADDLLIYGIALNARRPERIYLGTSDGVYRSIDQGAQWQKTALGLPKNTRVFDIKMTRVNNEADVIFVACGTKGVYTALDDEKPLWAIRNYGLEPAMITSLVAIR